MWGLEKFVADEVEGVLLAGVVELVEHDQLGVVEPQKTVPKAVEKELSSHEQHLE